MKTHAEIGAVLLQELTDKPYYREGSYLEDGYEDAGGCDYKPAYRCMCILLAPSDFRREHLDNVMVGFEDFCEILKATHPYFVPYLADQRCFEHCKWLFEDVFDVWKDEEE